MQVIKRIKPYPGYDWNTNLHYIYRYIKSDDQTPICIRSKRAPGGKHIRVNEHIYVSLRSSSCPEGASVRFTQGAIC